MKISLILSTVLSASPKVYDLHMENKTGGSAALLIRGGNAGDTVNITGKKPDGSYYLDSGSLRGYLEVYNGRAIFSFDGFVITPSPY